MTANEKVEINIEKLNSLPITKVEKFLVDTLNMVVPESKDMEINIHTEFYNHSLTRAIVTTSNLDYKAFRIEMSPLKLYISKQNGRTKFEPITELDLYLTMLIYNFSN